MINLHYVSGSRADFGLMARTLIDMSSDSDFVVGVIVTGQNTVPAYGDVAEEITNCGLNILETIPVKLSGSSGAEMALAVGDEIIGLTQFWSSNRPDAVMILGDRGEAFSAALVAVHLGIHIIHIHGGDRSGTLDESFRHAISKLSHYHFTATCESRERLIKMGERPEHVHTVGAPGLVLPESIFTKHSQQWLENKLGIDASSGVAVLVYHPVVQEGAQGQVEFCTIVKCLRKRGFGILILSPNSDDGGLSIESEIKKLHGDSDVATFSHLPRDLFLSYVANSRLLIGNSSSGIIEAASLGLVSVNVGSRQNLRQSNDSTFHCAEVNQTSMLAAIDSAAVYRGSFSNIYGDGTASVKITRLVKKLKLHDSELKKSITY